MGRAIIAMSGGVDSSVAALLAKEQGLECIGVTMKLFVNETAGFTKGHPCCTLDDVEDARSAARAIGIPYYVFNFTESFREAVIDRFIAAYENGATPNPCIDCNRYLKFERLFRRAEELECDYVVTGHYAKIEYDEKAGRYILKRAADLSKDQSYVLYSMTQEQLAHTLFPLGGMNKADVRELARRHGLITADKHDSQDICFVQNGDYADFIERFTGKRYPCGSFIDKNGKVLGEHRGIIRYTVGQRRGLGISAEQRLYVSEVNPSDNTVTVTTESELYTKKLTAEDVNLISVSRIDEPLRLTAKIRYAHRGAAATVTQLDGGRLSVEFDEPQRAVTKGQAVVLYDGDIVVGGGRIASAG